MFDVNRFVVPHSYGLGKYFKAFENSVEILFSFRELGIIVLCLVLATLVVKREKIESINSYAAAVGFSIIFLFTVLSMGQITEFLYFQF